MPVEHLSKCAKIFQAVTISAGAAAATPINGAIVDMTGFDGCLVIVNFGTIVSGAITSVKVQQGDAANMSDAADIAGSNQAVSDTSDDSCFYADVYRPGKRYLRAVIGRGTQAATCNATYLLYGARERPVSQPAGVSGEASVDAPEGAA